jgi:uncharacterized cupin superfamily protein
MDVVDLRGSAWDREQERPGWRKKSLGVGRRLGRELLGASLYELPPGEKTSPYHFHWGQEEWLLVIAGRPMLRTPGGERELAPGELVAFPRGPDGAHLLRNDSREPARLLMLSSPVQYDVCEYPDSRKVAAFGPGHESRIFPIDAAVDYFEGEE